MILGILADTHDRHHRAAYAITLLERLGAEAFIHCGDIGEAVLDELAGRRAWFVWGNTDLASPQIERYARTLGLIPAATIPLELKIAGRVLHVYHGHEPAFARLQRLLRKDERTALAALTSGVDYILHGHTHRVTDMRVGPTRWINPGALDRAETYTVATLDVARDALRFWQVDESAGADEPPRPFTPSPV